MSTATPASPRSDRVYFWDPGGRQPDGYEDFYHVCAECGVEADDLTDCPECGLMNCSGHRAEDGRCLECGEAVRREALAERFAA